MFVWSDEVKSGSSTLSGRVICFGCIPGLRRLRLTLGCCSVTPLGLNNRVKYGEWRMEYGVWSMEYGVWSMEYGGGWICANH